MKDYLERIGAADLEANADLPTLKALQHRHLLNVPFENLDIHWKRPIVLHTDKFYRKVVEEKRGGFCYELNGLFNDLLRSLGFQTRLISARVFSGNEPGPEFDHAAIIVTIGENEYLTDVGFGAFTAEPLQFILGESQTDATGVYTIQKFDDEYFAVAKHEDSSWRSEYMFRDIPRDLNDFSEMCDFQQFSPESHFTKGKLCSIMTDTGRKTLRDNRFIVTINGEKRETPVDSEDDFYSILKGEFDITAVHI